MKAFIVGCPAGPEGVEDICPMGMASIILFIILFVALALWLAGFLLLGRLRPCARAGATGPLLSVSVIIPARNEEHNLPALLRSLASQPVRPREVLVVDDSSTDRTAELARQLGATVIASKPLPDGWRGKTWACHQGAQAATSDVLLFVDADTWFEADGLAQTLSGYTGGAFSVGPYHAVRKPYEQLSLFFNFNMVAGTVPRGLFGQMLLVDRESYRRVGGHQTVQGRILENFWLAGRFSAAGIPVRSVMGRGVFSFRMYPNGLRELIGGVDQGLRVRGRADSARDDVPHRHVDDRPRHPGTGAPQGVRLPHP